MGCNIPPLCLGPVFPDHVENATGPGSYDKSRSLRGQIEKQFVPEMGVPLLLFDRFHYFPAGLFHHRDGRQDEDGKGNDQGDRRNRPLEKDRETPLRKN